VIITLFYIKISQQPTVLSLSLLGGSATSFGLCQGHHEAPFYNNMSIKTVYAIKEGRPSLKAFSLEKALREGLPSFITCRVFIPKFL
jgi:hypothetical protein